VQLNILFNNIPQGFDISGCDVVETYSNGTASTGLAFMNFSSVSAFLPVLTVVLASPGSGKYRSHHFDLHKCKQGISDSSLKRTRHHCPSEPCARGGSIEQQRWRTNKPYDWVDPAVPASIAAGDTADGCFFFNAPDHKYQPIKRKAERALLRIHYRHAVDRRIQCDIQWDRCFWFCTRQQ